MRETWCESVGSVKSVAPSFCHTRLHSHDVRFGRYKRYGRDMSNTSYDLVVIGSGPAGQKAALNAAKLGKRAAIIDRANSVGGVCIHTGTIPSKAIREAVMHLTAINERQVYGDGYAVKHDI